MSCMNLTKNHYQFVANSLNRLHSQFDRFLPFYETRKNLGKERDAIGRESAIIKFIRSLQESNDIAYSLRYGEDPDPNTIDYVEKIEPLGGDINPFKLLKSLECIDYQCTESNYYCASGDRKLLQAICDDCRHFIIGEIRSYQSAPWGID